MRISFSFVFFIALSIAGSLYAADNALALVGVAPTPSDVRTLAARPRSELLQNAACRVHGGVWDSTFNEPASLVAVTLTEQGGAGRVWWGRTSLDGRYTMDVAPGILVKARFKLESADDWADSALVSCARSNA